MVVCIGGLAVDEEVEDTNIDNYEVCVWDRYRRFSGEGGKTVWSY